MMNEYRNPDYDQYEKNNQLSFALASMMFDRFTHIVVRRRRPGHGVIYLGGGNPVTVMERYGDLKIESCVIRPDCILQITVI